MAVIYSSRMESLAWFPYTDHGVSALKSGWGIDAGNAMTCCHSGIIKPIQPTYATELHEGTIRWQYCFLHTSGSAVETQIMRVRVGSAYNVFFSAEFSAYVTFSIDGSINVYVEHSTSIFPGETRFISAPGVFTLDGIYYAFQLRFNFPSHTTFEFDLLINNVVILTNSITTTADPQVCGPTGGTPVYRNPWTRLISSTDDNSLCSNQAEIAGINDILLFNRRYSVNTMSSFVELIIDDSKLPVSYLPGNASKLKADTCTGGIPDPPIEPPVEPSEVGTGIYFINPSKTTLHDSYYGGIEKKIPNPTIKTALLGE